MNNSNIPDFIKVLYTTETQFAPGDHYSWPYDLESAKMIVDYCEEFPSLKELTSNYIFVFREKGVKKDSLVSTLWQACDDDYTSDFDFHGYEDFPESTVRFYQEKVPSQEEGGNMSDEFLTQLCPKIKKWDYSTIVCSALFFQIQNLFTSATDRKYEIPSFFWRKWMPLILNSTFGPKVVCLLQRNAVFEISPHQAIDGIKSFFFDHPNLFGKSFWLSSPLKSEQFTALLELLRIPQPEIQQLVTWTFQKQDFSKFISFLDNYTFTEFTTDLFDEFLACLPLTKEEENQLLEEMQPKLENFDIWGSTLDDFFISSKIENYQQLVNETKRNLEKAYLLALKYKEIIHRFESEDEDGHTSILSSMPPITLLEKYLSKLSEKEYKEIKKALFQDRIEDVIGTTFQMVALFLTLIPGAGIDLVSSGIIVPPIQLGTNAIGSTISPETYRMREVQQTFAASNVVRSQPRQAVKINASFSPARAPKIGLTNHVFDVKDKKGVPTTIQGVLDSENQLSLVGTEGGYNTLREMVKSYKNWRLEDSSGLILVNPDSLQVDHIFPNNLGQSLKMRGESVRYDESPCVIAPRFVNNCRTAPGEFIRSTSYEKSDTDIYSAMIHKSVTAFNGKLEETDYGECEFFGSLGATRKDHLDHLNSSYRRTSELVMDRINDNFLKKDNMNPNLVAPFVEAIGFNISVLKDISDLKTLIYSNPKNPENAERKTRRILNNLDNYNKHISGLAPHYANTSSEKELIGDHGRVFSDVTKVLTEAVKRYPDSSEFQDILNEVKKIQLQANAKKSLSNLDQAAQDLGLHDANGKKGRALYFVRKK